MRPISLAAVLAAAIGVLASIAAAQDATSTRPYKVLKTSKVGGEGGYDYIFADVEGRRLYVPRGGPTGLMVFDLDTLAPAGTIPDAKAGGVTVVPTGSYLTRTTNVSGC